MNNKLTTINSVSRSAPQQPVFAYRPTALEKATRFFLKNFQGKVIYAVKTNPEPHIIEDLKNQGVDAFDVASLAEVAHIKRYVPNAQLFFMHPIKSRYAIKASYFNYGVRHFSLDSEDELMKIVQETNYANDLNLFVRISIPNTYAELNLAEKFGIDLQEAVALLQSTSRYATKLGICFHVGSQCMHPDAYRIAIRMAANIIEESGVKINYFNVGGGFPSVYPGMIPPPLIDYFSTIHEEFAPINKNGDIELLCEPGRALVAESSSVIVRVDLRKENMLYINDGTYGSLFDAGKPHFIFPVKLLRNEQSNLTHLLPFSFYGPTCDSLDFMKGPFYLPEDIREGDYIEIGQVGAYGRTLVTQFNGFGPQEGVVFVSDNPLMTMYGQGEFPTESLEKIAVI